MATPAVVSAEPRMNERRDNPRPQILACFRNLHSDPPVGDVNLFTCEAIGREKSSPVAAVSQLGEAKPPRQCIIILRMGRKVVADRRWKIGNNAVGHGL